MLKIITIHKDQYSYLSMHNHQCHNLPKISVYRYTLQIIQLTLKSTHTTQKHKFSSNKSKERASTTKFSLCFFFSWHLIGLSGMSSNLLTFVMNAPGYSVGHKSRWLLALLMINFMISGVKYINSALLKILQFRFCSTHIFFFEILSTLDLLKPNHAQSGINIIKIINLTDLMNTPHTISKVRK